MKYYYKTPEQLQKEIQEHIKHHKISPYNRTFLMIFLNILIIFITFLILDKSGILHNKYATKTIKSITYEIKNGTLVLYFDVHRSIIITSKPTKDPQIFILEEVHLLTIDNEEISIKVNIPKSIIDNESNSLSIPLNQNLEKTQIKNIFIVLNQKLIQLKKH